MPDPTLTRYRTAVTEADSHRMHGRVTNLIGLVIEVTGLRAEIGELGIETLRAVKERLDPAGIMNPGKLIP